MKNVISTGERRIGDDRDADENMVCRHNPCCDGTASAKIAVLLAGTAPDDCNIRVEDTVPIEI